MLTVAAELATTSSASAAAVIAMVLVAVVVVQIAAMWRIFTKAGRPGWASIVPIYNSYVMLKIAGKPGWWLVLFFFPLVNVVLAIAATHGLSKSFGHGAGFTIGMIFLPFVFYPAIAFSADAYLGAGVRGWTPQGRA